MKVGDISKQLDGMDAFVEIKPHPTALDASARIAEMQAARLKCRQISGRDIVPPEVHQAYEQRWQLDQAALVAADRAPSIFERWLRGGRLERAWRRIFGGPR